MITIVVGFTMKVIIQFKTTTFMMNKLELIHQQKNA
jgi:hypothetical protein